MRMKNKATTLPREKVLPEQDAGKTSTRLSQTKPPRYIQVGYQKIEVFLVPDLAGENGVEGEYAPDQHKILVQTGLPDVEQANVVLHELNHAIYYIYGLAAKDPEERVVNQMANGLMEVMMRNPELVRYFNKVWTRGKR